MNNYYSIQLYITLAATPAPLEPPPAPADSTFAPTLHPTPHPLYTHMGSNIRLDVGNWLYRNPKHVT